MKKFFIYALVVCLCVSCKKEKCCTPSITILSQNSGEVYQSGQQITVNWSSKCVEGNINEINITSIKSSDSWWIGTFDKDLPNSGHATITLLNSSSFTIIPLSYGKYFKIQIIAEGGNVVAESNIFTINP